MEEFAAAKFHEFVHAFAASLHTTLAGANALLSETDRRLKGNFAVPRTTTTDTVGQAMTERLRLSLMHRKH
jgi:hypothetical protein